MMDISVVICTYNPGNHFRETLMALLNMKVAFLNVEIIIVDNASTNDFASVFHKEIMLLSQKFVLKLIKETYAGLSYARKRGINTASGEIIIFCDDDNALNTDYLRKAYELMNQYTDVGAIGGRSTLPWITTLGTQKLRMLAVGRQSGATGFVKQNYLWGAGLVVRRKVAAIAVNTFDPLCVGRTKNNTEIGDDGEMCVYIKALGYKLFYSDDLVFSHNFPESRLSSNNIKTTEKEMRSQVNYRILDFLYNVSNFNFNNFKYVVYCFRRPFVAFEAIKRLKALKKLRYYT